MRLDVAGTTYGVRSTVNDTSGSVYAVYGDGGSTSATNYGIYGTGQEYGVYGQSGGWAGYFNGDVKVTGDLSVNGSKSSIVTTRDFGTRTLYAIESPENWFEDFGTARLINGNATVTLESIFAQTVNLQESYHVFLTPICDEAVLLFVTDKDATGFTVQGVTLSGEQSSCAFDYRIVAKRLGYENRRLESADMPSPPGGGK